MFYEYFCRLLGFFRFNCRRNPVEDESVIEKQRAFNESSTCHLQEEEEQTTQLNDDPQAPPRLSSTPMDDNPQALPRLSSTPISGRSPAVWNISELSTVSSHGDSILGAHVSRLVNSQEIVASSFDYSDCFSSDL